MRIELPVANGLRTDHPVPGLPFVDDEHLPIHDGQAIAAHGRHVYNPGWGRHDRDRDEPRRFNAITNDQFVLTYSWLVRHDPDYGRTVLLYVDGDEKIMHEIMPKLGDPLVHRAGGYWWDGTTWHRPAVIQDLSTDTDVAIPVPGATSITARDILNQRPGDAAAGTLADITEFKPGGVDEDQWRHDLAYWALHRPTDALPLEQCILDVTAPELARPELVSLATAGNETGLSRAELDDALDS